MYTDKQSKRYGVYTIAGKRGAIYTIKGFWPQLIRLASYYPAISNSAVYISLVVYMLYVQYVCMCFFLYWAIPENTSYFTKAR